MPALYAKCLGDIELAREKVRRQVYVTKHQVAVDMARQSAQAEVTFLDGEIAMMETAIAEMQVSITQATEAIEEALAKRGTLIFIEEKFGEILNAFWSNISRSYNPSPHGRTNGYRT